MPLIIDIKPSKILRRMLLIAHALALLALQLSTLSFTVAIILHLLLILSAAVCYQRYVNKRSRWFISEVRMLDDGSWCIRLGNSGQLNNLSLAGYYRHPRLLILNFSGVSWQQHLYSAVFFNDSADTELIRKLRVQLAGIAIEENDKVWLR